MNRRILFLISLFLFSLTAYGKATDVYVVNPPADPVNVQGLVNVGNDVGSPVPVTIQNDPVPVTDAFYRAPVSVRNVLTFVTSTLATNLQELYTVPSGYMLVMEDAWLVGAMPTGEIITLAFINCGPNAMDFPVGYVAGNVSGSNHLIRFYCSENTVVTAQAQRDVSSMDTPAVTFGFTGYLVPNASPSLAP